MNNKSNFTSFFILIVIASIQDFFLQEVNAFLMPKRSFESTHDLTNKINRCSVRSYHVRNGSKKSSQIITSFIYLHANENNESSDELKWNTKKRSRVSSSSYSSSPSSSQSIEELYKTAMEEDKEWFNSFIKDNLGEDYLGDGEIDDLNRDMNRKRKEVALRSKENGNDTYQVDLKVDKSPQEYEYPTEDFTSSTEISNNSTRRGHEDRLNKNDFQPQERVLKNRDNGKSPPTSVQPDVENETSKSESNNEDGFIINFLDMYNVEQKIPFSIVSKLGYKASDVVKLRAEVLELIIEDEIPIPTGKNGLPQVPRRWKVDSKDEREVKILKKRRPLADRLPRGERQKVIADRQKIVDNSRRVNMRTMSSDIPKRRRRQSKRESRKKDSNSSSLWMDIPTFKQYLRREAELRLAILGPDWEDWVKGESDWRLNLYKGWLQLIDDGFGDDIFDDIAHAPPERRSRSRSRPKDRRSMHKDDEEARRFNRGPRIKRDINRQSRNRQGPRPIRIRDEEEDAFDEYQNQQRRSKQRSRADYINDQEASNRNNRNPRSW